MLKVGIIGAGGIAKSFHIPAWKEVADANVTAICDIREDAAKELAKSHSLACYSSYEEMISNEDLDIIDICTPNTLHAKQAIYALENDLHVVIEKPIVTDSSDLDLIIQKAKEKNKKVMCAQHQRFRPPTKVARELIASGALGEIYYAKAIALEVRNVPTQNQSFTNKELSGGGPLMDLGVHILDLTWWLMGCPKFDSCFASTYKKLADLPNTSNPRGGWDSYNVEELATGLIKFKNGATLSLETSYLLNTSERAFSAELMGTKGGLLWPDMILTTDENGEVKHKKIEVDDQSLASVAEMRHFVDCIKNNRETMIPLEESKQVIEMIESIYESAGRC